MIDEKGREEGDWLTYSRDFSKTVGLEDVYLEREQQGLVGVMSPRGNGNIPILYARGEALAEAWENSLIALGARGGFVRTQYDAKTDGSLYTSPPSLDCTMHLIVEDPSSEPMIHRCFPGGMADLEEYRQEVVDGIKDHWVRDQTNHEDTRWEYTYHGRIFNYDVPGLDDAINQFTTMAANLAESPITRRAQVISWKPWEDLNIGDPACFQSLWGRTLRTNPEFEFYSDDKTGDPMLNLDMRFRSRDAYNAAFMNSFAFIHLVEDLARRISEKRGEKVKLGRLLDQSDSYHIYGDKLEDFNGRFVGQLKARSFEDRTWTRDSMQTLFQEAKPMIKQKIEREDAKNTK